VLSLSLEDRDIVMTLSRSKEKSFVVLPSSWDHQGFIVPSFQSSF
jgi:hypothetical protein